MYKYYLLMRGRSIGTHPKGECGWTDYTERQFVPEIGRYAWGELYYENPLTDQEVHDYELYDCGYVNYVEYMDVYKSGRMEMHGVHGMRMDVYVR